MVEKFRQKKERQRVQDVGRSLSAATSEAHAGSTEPLLEDLVFSMNGGPAVTVHDRAIAPTLSKQNGSWVTDGLQTSLDKPVEIEQSDHAAPRMAVEEAHEALGQPLSFHGKFSTQLFMSTTETASASAANSAGRNALQAQPDGGGVDVDDDGIGFGGRGDFERDTDAPSASKRKSFMFGDMANSLMKMEEQKAAEEKTMSEDELLIFNFGISADELVELKEMFQTFDIDQDGLLSIGEVKEMYLKLGVPKYKLKKRLLRDLMQEIDGDGSGGASFKEFLQVALEPCNLRTRPYSLAIRSSFKEFLQVALEPCNLRARPCSLAIRSSFKEFL
jgi:Ca2+-binding EF-hand superfamily protein